MFHELWKPQSKSRAHTATLSAPDSAAGYFDPHLRQRLLDTHGQVWVSLLWGHCSFLLGPGAQGSVCVLRESVSPVLCKFWWLYGGVNGDLLQEGLWYTQVCCTQSPWPCGRPLLTHTSRGDTQTLKGRSDSVSVGYPGEHKVWVLFVLPECLWWVWGLILNMILPLLPFCWGTSPCPWTWDMFFWWDPTFSCWWLFSSEL